MICCPPTARRCCGERELRALEGDRGAARGGGGAQHRLGGGILSRRHDGGAVLDDPRLDRGDLGDRLAQPVGVVEVDRREHRDVAVGGVRRVPRAAHADLEHEHVDRRVGEGDEGEHREQLEEGERRVVARRRARRRRGRRTARSRPTRRRPAASAMGSPSIMMRSVKRSRCGLVNRPVRRPWARTRLSIMRLVDVLPFVPVTCTTRYVRCGSSSSSSTRRVRSTRGCTHRSPCRCSSAA